MKLAIDIGNSFTHFGIFRSRRLVKTFKTPTNSKFSIPKFYKKYLQRYSDKIEKAGISSVVPEQTKQWVKYALKNLNIKPVIINNKNKLPIRIKVKNSNTLGSDRICNAAAGYEYFGRKANVVICSFGTANTYDFVLKNGDLIGGIIAPGIGISAKSMYKNTGKLPLLKEIDFKFSKSIIGRNTKHAIQSGLMNYPLFATEKIIKSAEKEFKRKFKVIITGGMGRIIQKKLGIKSVYIPNTVLQGINIILNQAK